MATLSSPSLSVVSQGGDVVKVTTKVNVTFNQFEKFMIGQGLSVTVACRMWGEDSGINGGDDNLFSMGTKPVSSTGTVQFTRNVPRHHPVGHDPQRDQGGQLLIRPGPSWPAPRRRSSQGIQLIQRPVHPSL